MRKGCVLWMAFVTCRLRDAKRGREAEDVEETVHSRARTQEMSAYSHSSSLLGSSGGVRLPEPSLEEITVRHKTLIGRTCRLLG